MLKISTPAPSTARLQALTPEPAAEQGATGPAGTTAASALPAAPGPGGAASPATILRGQHRMERLLRMSAKPHAGDPGRSAPGKPRPDPAESASAREATRESMSSAAESAHSLALSCHETPGLYDLHFMLEVFRLPPLHRLEYLKAVAAQLPISAGKGDGELAELLAQLHQHARGPDRHANAAAHAADQRIPAQAAFMADNIRDLGLLAAGLDDASLARVLTTLATSLPHEKSEGSLEAMHAFLNAIEQHAGRLDDAARAQVLTAFNLRTKPRKTNSPYQRQVWRKSAPAKSEFLAACRAVRELLKHPPAISSQAVKHAFAPAKAGAAAAAR